MSFNNIQVERVSHHKHLHILLYEKLNFKQNINTSTFKINKGIPTIKKLRHTLPRKSSRPLIDYGDIIYDDQPQNESFCEKLESVQYKTMLAITGAIQGTSCDKIYQELGLESYKSRRWYKRLRYMFKTLTKLLII